MGVPHYTIVDLPITAAAAAYFLGRVIGGEHLAFYGEERVRTTFLPGRRSKSISILPTQAFFEGDERFDLAVNVDSFTEMALPTASRYWRELEQRAAMICSINHEANHFTVKDLYGHGRLGDVQRVPCWMRRGYVEEIVRLPPDRSPLSDGVGALRGIRPALGRKSG
jgi:hypothetical protein